MISTGITLSSLTTRRVDGSAAVLTGMTDASWLLGEVGTYVDSPPASSTAFVAGGAATAAAATLAVFGCVDFTTDSPLSLGAGAPEATALGLSTAADAAAFGAAAPVDATLAAGVAGAALPAGADAGADLAGVAAVGHHRARR